VKQFNIVQIGVVHSPFKEKFGTPRQPGLITDAVASIELLAPFDREEALQGIEQFSHLWISFIFHHNKEKSWTPKVRPPRLGGNKSIGVFASRSPYRPNPTGLSVVELSGVRKEKNKLFTTTGSQSHTKEHESRKKEIDEFLNTVPVNVKGIIYELFPQVKGVIEGMNYGSDFQERWEKELRICATISKIN